MSDFKEISYEKYDDEKTKAICTICIDDKHLVSYAKKAYENREWWTPANHFIKLKNGKNVSIEGYLPESRSMDIQIKNFLAKIEESHKDEVADEQPMPF